jgi:flagellin
MPNKKFKEEFIMIINHNMGALNANRNMNINSGAASKSMEKLSSGMRINRAGDDAAGLAISEKMRSQIRGLDQASSNAQDAISMIQTAEGGLNETTSILQRMRELSVQASTNVLAQQDSESIGDEMVALRDEIDRIGNTTDFNGKKLLNGNMATAQGTADTLKAGAASGAGVTIDTVDVSSATAGQTFTVTSPAAGDVTITNGGISQTISLADANFAAAGQKSVLNFDKLGVKITLNSTAANAAGVAATTATALATLSLTSAAGSSAAQIVVGSNATANETVSVAFSDMRASALETNLGTLTKTSLNTVASAKLYTGYIDTAIKNVSTQRSNLGAYQNRLEHTIANLNTSSENTTAAESRIRDVDMAKEMSTFSKNNILSQAAQAMLAQANQQPQQVLQLLR